MQKTASAVVSLRETCCSLLEKRSNRRRHLPKMTKSSPKCRFFLDIVHQAAYHYARSHFFDELAQGTRTWSRSSRTEVRIGTRNRTDFEDRPSQTRGVRPRSGAGGVHRRLGH